MSGYGGNPIFFNKKNKDCMDRTLATPLPTPPMPNNISFLPNLLPSFKLDVMCVSPLLKSQ